LRAVPAPAPLRPFARSRTPVRAIDFAENAGRKTIS
jgi:hypothetical protein